MANSWTTDDLVRRFRRCGEASGAGASADAKSWSYCRWRFRAASGGGRQAVPAGSGVNRGRNRRRSHLGRPTGRRTDAYAARRLDRTDCQLVTDAAHQWRAGTVDYDAAGNRRQFRASYEGGGCSVPSLGWRCAGRDRRRPDLGRLVACRERHSRDRCRPAVRDWLKTPDQTRQERRRCALSPDAALAPRQARRRGRA